MDLHKATVEAFERFLEFHHSFNVSFKTSIAALTHARQNVTAADGSHTLQGLISSTGEPWKHDIGAHSVHQAFDQAVRATTLLGIVQVYSAIDDFCSSVSADVARWRSISSKRTTSGPADANLMRASSDSASADAEDEKNPDLLESLCHRHGWETAPFAAWRPVLKYFTLARNCIAHRSGIVSTALERCHDAELAAALKAWPRDKRQTNSAISVTTPAKRGAPPTPPSAKVGTPLDLQPRHAIFYLDAAYRACNHVNSAFMSELGDRGMIFLAAYHTLLAMEPRVATEARNSPESVVCHALARRYRIPNTDAEEVIQHLKAVSRWKRCIERHGVLYPTAKKPVPRRLRIRKA